MFADSLLENSWSHRTRRSWTTLTSFGLQAVAIGLLLLIPLLETVGLPLARTVSTPISLGSPNHRSTPPAHGTPGSVVPIIAYAGQIMAPRSMPHGLPPVGGSEPEPAGWMGDRIGDGILPGGPGLPLPMGGTRPVMPAPVLPTKPAFRPSNLLEGMLIRRVQPMYPPLARAARVQGSVVLAAVISKDGTMQHLQLISGHPMLVPAALEAVGQWRYKPYILNGEAIEVETQITVNFILGGS